MNLYAVDQALRAWVVHHRVGVLNPVMVGLTTIGAGGVVWIAIMLALMAMRRATWKDVLRLVLMILVTTAAADFVFKPLVHRPRPFLVLSDVPVIGHTPHDWSFPSGHAADAVVGAFALTRAMPAGQVAWWILAAGIAYSRVYLGVHYPYDVAGSAVLGALCTMLITAGLDRLRRSRRMLPCAPRED